MPSKPRLYLVDVFAERPYTGNQLAVVVGASESEWPAARMQAFAREMNFSETTFTWAAPRDGAFDVRIFTPAEELPFAGHPTLGTAWVLRSYYSNNDPRSLSLRLRIGVVPVEFDSSSRGEVVRMRPRPPTLGDVVDGRAMAAHLGIPASAIDPRHPCRRVSVGIEFVIVPLVDLASLRAARPKSLPAAASGQTLGVFAFAPEVYEPGGDLAARMFFDAFGIREDPATGSANACLAAYLSSRRYFGTTEVSARVQQGYEMGRPSCIVIGAKDRGGTIEVDVAGKVVLVATGDVA